eukprot:11159793-Lingulodinium_polyedra.AAC.1
MPSPVEPVERPAREASQLEQDWQALRRIRRGLGWARDRPPVARGSRPPRRRAPPRAVPRP